MPRWLIGWDVFCWLGHRRFARHWSVPQLRAEFWTVTRSSCRKMRSRIICSGINACWQRVSRISRCCKKNMPTTREVVLSIDGLQPEKGHETLYVVRELGRERVWFAQPLLSSATEEIRPLIVQAKEWAERLGCRVRLWMSDKQDAFVKTIASVCPGVPHRYCSNHFLRDLAKPVLELDSHAKVQMRGKIRGLRGIEREVLKERAADAGKPGPGSKTRGDDGGDRAAWAGRRARLLCRGSWHHQRQSRRPVASAGSADVGGAGRSAKIVATQPPTQKRGHAEALLERLAGCIDKGRNLVVADAKASGSVCRNDSRSGCVVGPSDEPMRETKTDVRALERKLLADADPICQQMGRVMASFKPGLFAGGGRGDWPRDNLDLERWFRLPKGHERRIHGRCHAGVRIVQEGATMMLALDAHRHHPQPFTRRGASALPRRRGSGQPKGSDPPSQGDASRALHEETRGVVAKTRRTVRGVTPPLKRVIDYGNGRGEKNVQKNGQRRRSRLADR